MTTASRWVEQRQGIRSEARFIARVGFRAGTEQDAHSVRVSVLRGEKGTARDIVLMNAALAIYTASRADDLAGAVALAAESIDSGAATEKLNRFREIAV